MNWIFIIIDFVTVIAAIFFVVLLVQAMRIQAMDETADDESVKDESKTSHVL